MPREVETGPHASARVAAGTFIEDPRPLERASYRRSTGCTIRSRIRMAS